MIEFLVDRGARARLARRNVGDRHDDLWESVRLVFEALSTEGGLPKLALPGLGGLRIGRPGRHANAARRTPSRRPPDDPLLDQACAHPTAEERVKALFALTVCAPACGSGHFLVAAPAASLIAAALTPTRLDTRIIERRLGPDLRVTDNECHVALIGVDNLPTRRLTSEVGWDLVIDVGLGHGSQNFASMHLRRFPGTQHSDQIAGWKTNPSGEITIPDTPAFAELAEHHDTCGVVELAGKAVGASFVGITAACLAAAEATRELHGGTGHNIFTLDMLTPDSDSAPAAKSADIIGCPLVNVQGRKTKPRGSPDACSCSVTLPSQLRP